MYKNAQLTTPFIDASKSSDIIVNFDWISPYGLKLKLGSTLLATTLVGQQIVANISQGFPTGTFRL